MDTTNQESKVEGFTPDLPFALFTGATYYPSPGWQGHQGQYATLEEASSNGRQLSGESFEWWQVVDLRELRIVAGEGVGHTGLFVVVPAA